MAQDGYLRDISARHRAGQRLQLKARTSRGKERRNCEDGFVYVCVWLGGRRNGR